MQTIFYFKFLRFCDISVISTPGFLVNFFEKFDTMIRLCGHSLLNIYATAR